MVDKPILIDKDADLLEHVLEQIDVDKIKYYEESEDGQIRIVIVGSFGDDDEADAFFQGTNKNAHDAYERAMKGTIR